MNASVRHLPAAMSYLAPEIETLTWPDEPKSDCQNCPLEGKPFLRKVRCCTYEPAIPNFLLGRALTRDDAGAERIRTRIRQRHGVTALGIQPSAEWTRAYKADRETDFGRNPDWTCPYWVEGPLSCSIWRDRNAACRTWHCKHTEGVRGHQLWTATRQLLHAVEHRLATWCVSQAEPPTSNRGSDWATWYQQCSHAVEHLGNHELEQLADADLENLRRAVREADAGRDVPLPMVLGVDVRSVVDHGDEVELAGYTPWNTARFPHTIFVLLAELDGNRPWKQALARAQQAEPSVRSTWIRILWDLDIVRAPADPSIPWGFEAPDLDPEVLRATYAKSGNK